MRRRFEIPFNLARPALGVGDALILLGLATLLYVGARLALNAPSVVAGPDISLVPTSLPWYALLSVGRMLVAYLLSLLFTLTYGYACAHNRLAEKVLSPLLDVLQSVPILSFLPVVLLSLTAVLPQGFAVELSSIVLIVTSQVWNMTFSFYQSLVTLPVELREASAIFRLNAWLRFKTVELPFAALGLIWNSMMSWAGGWFFLMVAETFTVGSRDFRLPGLGSYLQAAANAGDIGTTLLGVGTLVLVIVLMDQFGWRPVLAWADKFKLEMVTGDEPPESWFYDLLSRSWLVEQFVNRVWQPFNERLDALMGKLFKSSEPVASRSNGAKAFIVIGMAAVLGLLYGGLRAAALLATLPIEQWARIGAGAFATLLRVTLSLTIATAWTVPVGVLIGTNRKLAAVLQPVVQIVASVPATALFPVILLALINVAGGLNIAAVLLMLMGTQWYVLFNVIAGAAAIPQDLAYTTELLQLKGWARWRTLILPALFPYLITGMITAGGGAWNASIVAEYVHFFARAMAVEPELLCLDEPFSALDVLSAEALRGELMELWLSSAIPTQAILMVTHNIEEAVLMADRIVVMDKDPGRIVAEIKVGLRHPRHRKDTAFQALVDRVYAAVAGKTEAGEEALGTAPGLPGETPPLPPAHINRLAGLLETINEERGRHDLYRLAEELTIELDDLLPVVEAAELMGFATVEEGDIVLTPLGQAYADASILARKEMLASRALRLPTIRWIYDTLQADADHRMAEDYFLDRLQAEFGDYAEAQLDTAINWGRYAELFEFDDDTDELYL